MPESGFLTPELSGVVERISNDVDSNLDGASSRLRRRQTRAIAVANAGAAYLLHLLARDISLEGLPDCASSTGVIRWAALFGLFQIPAAKATGTNVLTFTGVETTAVPIGTSVTRADGVEFETTTAGVITGGVFTADVEAVLTGIEGNTDAGVVLTLTSPLTGIDSEATVVSPGIKDGQDLESTEALRGRLLDRLQQPPQGGSNADYVAFTKQAVANTRAVFVGAAEPVPGEVTIRFIVEPPDGDPANAIPTAADRTAVQEFIGGTVANNFEDAAAPVPTIGDRIHVPPITAKPITITITNLTPNTTEVKQAVEASLKAMLLQRGRPDGQTLALSLFYGAIDAVPGEDSHEITSLDGAAPAGVVVPLDQFPTLGTVSYVP